MTFEELGTSSAVVLEKTLANGTAADLGSLVGWEFRGWNVLSPIARIYMVPAGLTRFAKGFFSRKDGVVEGYNVKIHGGGIRDPWTPRLREGNEVRHSYYRVHAPGQGEGREGRYPNSLYLHYGE